MVHHRSKKLNRVKLRGGKLVWTENPNFQGWACTECAWVFNPSWPLAGKSIDEMKTNFGQQRDKEFASHVCAEHPRTTENPH
jgi:rubredoxin